MSLQYALYFNQRGELNFLPKKPTISLAISFNHKRIRGRKPGICLSLGLFPIYSDFVQYVALHLSCVVKAK